MRDKRGIMSDFTQAAVRYKRTKDEDTFQELQQHSIPFTKSVITRHYNNLANHRDYKDIVSYCTSVVLLNTLKKYRLKKKCEFSTYYFYRLRGYLSRITKKYAHSIRLIYTDFPTLVLLDSYRSNNFLSPILSKVKTLIKEQFK